MGWCDCEPYDRRNQIGLYCKNLLSSMQNTWTHSTYITYILKLQVSFSFHYRRQLLLTSTQMPCNHISHECVYIYMTLVSAKEKCFELQSWVIYNNLQMKLWCLERLIRAESSILILNFSTISFHYFSI